MAKLMLKKHARKNTDTTYVKNENVFVRVGKKRGKTMKGYKVLSGKIKKSYKDDSYLVRLRLPGSRSFTEKRFPVEDISDFNGKRPVKNNSETRKRCQKSLHIVKMRNDRLDQMISQGF